MNAALVCVALGWLSAFVAVVAFQDGQFVARAAAKTPLKTPLWEVILFLSIGALLMTAGFRRLGETRTPDLGVWTARAWLTVLLGLAAAIRLYRADVPLGPFWDDWANPLIQPRLVLDKDVLFWMFPFGGHEPFFPYFLTLLRLLAPDLPNVVMIRLAGCLVDLAAFAVLYLAGRELGSRRIGLVAVGVAAVAQPTTQLTLTGMRAFCLTLAAGLTILALLRLFKRPTLPRFLLWGGALTFGIHTYSVYRSWALLVPLMILPWVLAPGVERRREPLRVVAGAGAVLFLFGILSGTVSSLHPLLAPWGRIWQGLAAKPWVLGGLFLLWSAATAAAWFARKGKEDRLVGWSAALGLTALLTYPLTRCVDFDKRLPALSALRKEGSLFDGLQLLLQKGWMTLRTLFHTCKDRPDLEILFSPYYDVFFQALVLLALAFLVSRFEWRKGLLLGLALLGTLIYVVSIDPSSTKLIASAPPLCLLIGWALSRIFEHLPRPKAGPRPKRRGAPFGFPRIPWATAGLSLFLVVYAAGAAFFLEKRLFGYWGSNEWPDTVVARKLAEDEPAKRVYLSWSDFFFGPNTQFILNEGRRYYLLKESNGIPLAQGEIPEDVVVYVDDGRSLGRSAPVLESLRRRYPTAQWTRMKMEYTRPADVGTRPSLWRVEIPGKALGWDAGDPLHLVRAEGKWLRRYSSAFYGWGVAGILKEERVERLYDPVPPERLKSGVLGELDPTRLGYFMTQVEIPGEGNYEWSVRSPHPVWVKVDGRTLLRKDKFKGSWGGVRKVRLGPGPHRLEVLVRFQGRDYEMPYLGWRPEGGEWEQL